MRIAEIIRHCFLVTGLAVVSSGAGAAQDPMQRLIGRTLTFEFDSGFTVEAYYPGATQMRWSAGGKSGTEKISVAQIAPGILFISWVETAGTTVSHVLDLDRQSVWSFVTYASGSGREGRPDHGTWRVLDANRQGP